MDQYAAQMQKQAMYDSQMRNSQCLGTLHQNGDFEPVQGYANQQRSAPPPAPPVGVLGMTEMAHSSFQQLSNALGELQERLGPITESYPEPGCVGSNTQNQISEASAVVGLRVLVERIDGKTAEIYRLIAALRV